MTSTPEHPALLRPIFPAPLQALLDRSMAEAVRTDPGQRQAARDRGLSHDGQPDFYAAMAGAAMPVPGFRGAPLHSGPEFGARHVVEFGTSSACPRSARRGPAREWRRPGRDDGIPAREGEPARAHFVEAGLDDLIELRVGDARETLAGDLPDPVDLLLLDAAKDAYATSSASSRSGSAPEASSSATGRISTAATADGRPITSRRSVTRPTATAWRRSSPRPWPALLPRPRGAPVSARARPGWRARRGRGSDLRPTTPQRPSSPPATRPRARARTQSRRR